MIIGINSLAAFQKPRTGVEEYVYQLIKHLARLKQAQKHRFLLYHQFGQDLDFKLPLNFSFKKLNWPLPMWTQLRLASEMLVSKPEVLFIPVHVLPQIHPQNSVVTIQGLEYEHYPAVYSQSRRRYLRFVTKNALKKARKIIVASKSTRDDLISLYGANSEKIEVVYHGFRKPKVENQIKDQDFKYILYLGRIEFKKNIEGLVEAFNLLKQKHKIEHKLVLAGGPGYGYHDLKLKIRSLQFGQDIIEKGYVSEKEKWQLLKNADLLAFISFYEGFGFPILEAQSMGCPIITSNISSMPEVAGTGAFLVKPQNIEESAKAMYEVIINNQLRKELIVKGFVNIKRFSWKKCALKTLKLLTS